MDSNCIDMVNMICNIVMAAAAVVIPIALFLAQRKIDKQSKSVGESNALLYETICTLIDERIEKLGIAQEKNVEGGDLKERALKYIAIKITATTSEVAQHLGIDCKEASRLLKEMSRIDGLIKPLSLSNPDSNYEMP